MRSRLRAVIGALLLLPGCGKHAGQEDTIARIGDRFIGMKELNRSYTLQPRWTRGQTQFRTYLVQLDELITQKIYAQEAEREGLSNDSLLQEYLGFLREKEMIKGLYREEIRKRVQIDSAEVRQLYEWSKKNVDYEYVFCRDSLRCASYGRELAGKSSGNIPLLGDSSARAGRREATKVGDVPSVLEREVFTARVGDVRGPLKVPGGYVVLKVTGGTQQKFLSENEFMLERQKIESLLTGRKADSLSAIYIASLMDDKDLRLNAPVFWRVAEYFYGRVKEAHVDPMKIQSINITSDELRLLDTDLTGMGDEVVATHREGNLTVRQLVHSLSTMPGSLRPRARTPENLKAAIGMIVRNQYLLKEAARRGLEGDPEVEYEFALQRDEVLASAYYDRRRGDVQVTSDEVEAFKKRAPVSEEQVFFKLNMAVLARDAKADSMLRAELPAVKSRYQIECDTAKIRSLLTKPDAAVDEEPLRVYVREIFQ